MCQIGADTACWLYSRHSSADHARWNQNVCKLPEFNVWRKHDKANNKKKLNRVTQFMRARNRPPRFPGWIRPCHCTSVCHSKMTPHPSSQLYLHQAHESVCFRPQRKWFAVKEVSPGYFIKTYRKREIASLFTFRLAGLVSWAVSKKELGSSIY